MQGAVVALASASFLLARILPGDKRPTTPGWTTKSADPNAFTDRDNVGLVCGVVHLPHRGGWFALVCVDLDSADANARADEFLPPTGMIDGRPGKPRSHRWYLVPLDSIPDWAWSTAPQASAVAREKCGHPGPFTKSFRGPNGKEALRFIATGGQANVPPSLHDSGEERYWEGGERGEPAIVSFPDLWAAVCNLAEAIGCRPPAIAASRSPRPRTRTSARRVSNSSTAVAEAADVPSEGSDEDGGDDGTVSENPFALPAADQAASERRVVGFLLGIPPADLPFDGSAEVEDRGGGDTKTFMILAQLLFSFQRGRTDAIRLFMEHVNPRLVPPNRPWDEAAIAHKVDWLIARGPDPRFPVGGLLNDPRYASGRGKRAGALAAVPADARLVYSSLAGVAPRPLTYLVPDFVPGGMLGMIAGEGGHGKSLITLDLIAAVTARRCPLGLDYPEPVAGSCVLIACEDDWERTIVPRLIARGADPARVYRIEGLKLGDGGVLDFDLSHARQLRQMVEQIGDVRLIVIDPAGAFVGRAGVDEHKDAELRSLLGPLSELANETGATVVMVKHLNKNVGVSAVQRVGGSAGYVNAVRFSYIVVPDRDDPTRKLFLPLKANVLPGDLKGRAYRISTLPVAEAHALLEERFPDLTPADRATIARQLVRTEWEPAAIDVDANAATAPAAGRRPAGQLDACKVVIRDFLGAYARPVEELDREVGRAFPAKVVKEAKRQLRELPPGDAHRLWTRALEEGGKWWAWVGPDQAARPRHPSFGGQSGPREGAADQTDGTGETGPTAGTAPQG